MSPNQTEAMHASQSNKKVNLLIPSSVYRRDHGETILAFTQTDWFYTDRLVLICYNLEPHAYLNSNQTLSEVLPGASAGKTHWPHQNHYIYSSKPQVIFIYFSLEFDGAVVDDLTVKHKKTMKSYIVFEIWVCDFPMQFNIIKGVSVYHYCICIKGSISISILYFSSEIQHKTNKNAHFRNPNCAPTACPH